MPFIATSDYRTGKVSFASRSTDYQKREKDMLSIPKKLNRIVMKLEIKYWERTTKI